MVGYEFSGYKLQMKFVSTFSSGYAAIGKLSNKSELLDCSLVFRVDFKFPKSTSHITDDTVFMILAIYFYGHKLLTCFLQIFAPFLTVLKLFPV